MSFNPHGKRFVFMVQELELGGAERSAIALAHWLQQRGATAEVWGLFRCQGAAGRLCDSLGLTTHQVFTHPWRPGLRRPWRLIRLALALRRARPDVILPYTLLPNATCGAVWRWTGASQCLWNQEDSGLGEEWIDADLVRYGLKQTPRYIAHGRPNREYLERQLGGRGDDIFDVPLGVSLSAPLRSRSAWRAQFQVPDDGLLVCNVGNLSLYKDHPTLLRAWRLLLDRLGPTASPPRLAVAGRPADRAPEVTRLVQELGLQGSVFLLGQTDDIAGLLQAADIFIHSSVSEGLPLSVLEAMHFGLPVIGTKLPGTRQALGEDAESYLVRPGDAAGMAALLSRMIADPALRILLGTDNRRRAFEHYTLDRMGAATLDVLGAP